MAQVLPAGGPVQCAASSIPPGTFCSRAVTKRKASGNDFQISKATTTSSDTGTGRPATSVEVVLRKPMGLCQPRYSMPIALTMPYWGLSIVRQIIAAAMTGSTYGISSSARTSPRPRKGRRRARARAMPTPMDPSVVRVA